MRTHLLLLTCALFTPCALIAQSTTFSYQGRLNAGDSPANGLFEMYFTLYDAPTNGNVVGTPETVAPLPVTNGLFTTMLDFGVAAFTGANRWLEIAVTVFGSDQPVVTLIPRQPILPTPYALHAYNAAALMSFTDAPMEIKVNGERALRLEPTRMFFDTVTNAPNLIGGSSANVVGWDVTGATIGGGGAVSYFGQNGRHLIESSFGTISGGLSNTISTQAGAATIAGGSGNTIKSEAAGAVIGGGSGNLIEEDAGHATIAGGWDNHIWSDGDTIGGGYRNTARGGYATVAGGQFNTASGWTAVVSGGQDNQAGGDYSSVGGGQSNLISGEWATIGGGRHNHATQYATVGGGLDNRAERGLATVGGGTANIAAAEQAFIGGGVGNIIESDADNSVIGGGESNAIRAFSASATVGGGFGNRILDESFHSTISGGAANFMANKVERSTIGGGANNTIGYYANATTIAGGMNNAIDGTTGGSTISGGWFNHINEEASLVTIAGGGNNLVSDNAGGAVISGGEFNQVYASFGTVGGGQGNAILFPGHYATIAGGLSNFVGNYYGTVAGGVNNEVGAQYAAIGGGQDNTIEPEADGSVIAGGSNNRIGTNAVSNFIGGGGGNRIDAASSSAIVSGFDNHLGSYASVISGGRENGILENAEFSAIAGGENNHIAAGSRNSAIGGGGNNQILVNSSHAMIPGGLENVATNLAFAAGKHAYAVHSGAFVWADASDVRFYSVSTNEFAVRATGGVRFATAVDGNGEPTAGVALAPGSGTWSSLSDRNAKENFATANPREILDKVTALPMTSWNYKAQDKSVRHLGPMAQDFHAAFGLGESERTITTVDADGVALAAIQGLNAKLEEELKTKDARIAELEGRLAGIEKLLATTTLK